MSQSPILLPPTHAQKTPAPVAQPTKSLHVMRHAQSRFNAGLGDERNSALSDEGRQQASAQTGEYDLVLTSPLQRAIDTLRLSQIKYRHHLITHLCREWRNVSLCDYLEGEEVSPDKHETDEQIWKRTQELVDLLRELHKVYPRILVVSHGGFLRFLTNGAVQFHGNCQRQNVFLA